MRITPSIPTCAIVTDTRRCPLLLQMSHSFVAKEPGGPSLWTLLRERPNSAPSRKTVFSTHRRQFIFGAQKLPAELFSLRSGGQLPGDLPAILASPEATYLRKTARRWLYRAEESIALSDSPNNACPSGFAHVRHESQLTKSTDQQDTIPRSTMTPPTCLMSSQTGRHYCKYPREVLVVTFCQFISGRVPATEPDLDTRFRCQDGNEQRFPSVLCCAPK